MRFAEAILRLALMSVLFAGGIALWTSDAQRAGAQESLKQQLVDRYAPIAMLRVQQRACDKNGEGYFPAPVDFLWENPDIHLRYDSGGAYADDPVLLQGLTPQDLVDAGPDTYLDFPGNPRDPGCGYETYFKEMAEDLGLEPTTYAHIVVDQAARKLYIQYWFYYYFNDWNNTHESDWEMIQVVFDGITTVEDALEFGPSVAAYAQHGGGETGTWTDAKVQKSGDRPIVFPSAGSHATYFDQHNFIGWGAHGTAFGCDNTTPPSAETPLDVILVPEVIDPDGEFAFFLFQGNWGQKEFAVYEGPKGPNMGAKWSDPTGAMSDWRASTLKVPDSSFGGVSATDAFCGLSAAGSQVFTYFGSHPWSVVAALLLSLGMISFVLYKVWAYFSEAIDIYGNELLAFLGIGSLVIPIGVVGGSIVQYLSGYAPLRWMEEGFNQSSGGSLAASLVVGGFQQVAMVLMVVPAVVFAMRDIRRGIRPGVRRSYAGAIRYLPVTVPSLIVFGVLILIGGIAWIFLPVVVYVLVRLQFFPEAAIIDEKAPFTEALSASWDATRGKWWKVFLASIGFQLLAVIPGPVVGALVLIVGGSRVGFANFLSSFVYALTIPIATIAITMVYHRIMGHEIVEPYTITRPAKQIEDAQSGAIDSVPSPADS